MTGIILGGPSVPSPEELCKLQAVELAQLQSQVQGYEAMLPTLANIAVVLVQRIVGDLDEALQEMTFISTTELLAANGVRLNVDPAPNGGLELSLTEADESLDS